MKKIITLLTMTLLFFASTTKAQIQKGNLFVGADLANFNFGLNSGAHSSVTINPKLAFFIHDNVAIGPLVRLGMDAAKGIEPTINYGIGGFGRYYINDTTINLLKHGRFFAEAQAGIQGRNEAETDNSTNGLGLGFGPAMLISLQTILVWKLCLHIILLLVLAAVLLTAILICR